MGKGKGVRALTFLLSPQSSRVFALLVYCTTARCTNILEPGTDYVQGSQGKIQGLPEIAVINLI